MEQFGWAVIGCGDIANTVMGEMVQKGVGRVVAAWNRTKSKADAFAEKFACKAYDTAEEAIKAEGVNAVYVATTHNMHDYYTKLAINCGVPVLCEKPVTVNVKQLDEVLDLAKEKKVYYAEAMWTWHNPVCLKVREWVNGGLIGEVKHVEMTYAFPMVQHRNNPRLTEPELAGGALLDIGIYPVRFAYELFGAPKNMECKGALSGGVDMEENIKMSYGGFDVDIYASMVNYKGEQIVIEGTDGKIVIPRFHAAKEATMTGRHNDSVKTDELLYGIELEHTAQDIKEGRTESIYCPVKATRDVMLLLDECRRQMGVVYPCEK